MSPACSICKKPALPGQGLHGISGDHWDCWKGQLVGILGYDPAAKFNAYAAGGHRVHRVHGNESLCGHEPMDSPGSRMRRARWVRVVGEVTCPHCLEAMASSSTTKVPR